MYVKCYRGNYDGVREGLVIANNQKEAAKVVGCSLYEFRKYWCHVDWPERFNLKLFTLYTKKMLANEEWYKGRCPLEND
jgi:hypothetical protein